jgi:glycosylphosphatidylinositol transamidase (GPIT) subunit GPI8
MPNFVMKTDLRSLNAKAKNPKLAPCSNAALRVNRRFSRNGLWRRNKIAITIPCVSRILMPITNPFLKPVAGSLKMFIFPCFLWVSLRISRVTAATWCVLIAGSTGFSNYRHQSDLCSAFSLLRHNGINNIITMSTDDAAFASQNPFYGKLYNKPSGTKPGKNVRKGCRIDYLGKSEVNIKNFHRVFTHSSRLSLAPRVNPSKNSNIFINFIDHGTNGGVFFPTGELLDQSGLLQVIASILNSGKARRVLLFVEACKSGSLFEGIQLPRDLFAVSATNATQNSFGKYCPQPGAPADMVKSKNIAGFKLLKEFRREKLSEIFCTDLLKEPPLARLTTMATKACLICISHYF